MPPAVRQGDLTSGHPPFLPTSIMMGSTDVLINNMGAARVGDPIIPHTDGLTPPHPSTISSGSGSVLVNDKPLARIGDTIACGDMLTQGSGNVISQ